jgi:hypothetical protein
MLVLVAHTGFAPYLARRPSAKGWEDRPDGWFDVPISRGWRYTCDPNSDWACEVAIPETGATKPPFDNSPSHEESRLHLNHVRGSARPTWTYNALTAEVPTTDQIGAEAITPRRFPIINPRVTCKSFVGYLGCSHQLWVNTSRQGRSQSSIRVSTSQVSRPNRQVNCDT